MAGLVTLDNAELDWEADGTPRSKQFQDIYFSRDGGLAESTYVYLQGNGIPERWPGYFRDQQTFQLFEAGFGTGLNFLLTCQAFLQQPLASEKRLRYVAVECYPLRQADLAKALSYFPELATLAEQLLAQYPPALRGWHSLHLAGGRIELVLLYEDIATALPALAATDWAFDAWYLDGFAPARNEAMWAESLWPAIGALSRSGATASTFSAAGAVRRGLQQAGFSVEKTAGFGRKRDMSVARFAGIGKANPIANTPRHVLILGAGIAGAATARALAERGVAVTVLDQQNKPGGTLREHASALASPRWSRDHNLRSQFQLSGFLILQRRLRQLFDTGEATITQHTEVLTLIDAEEAAREQQVLQELGLLTEHADWLTAAEASKIAGIALSHQAVLHRLALALDPAALCRALLQHDNIRVETGVSVIAVQSDNSRASITDDKQEALQHHVQCQVQCQVQSQAHGVFTADALVICGGADCRALLAPFPLRPVRGQSTDLPATAASASLRLPLRFGGYLTPAQHGQHLLGASYDGGVFDPQLQWQSQQDNLATLAWAQPELAAHWQSAPLAGDVGHRLVTPDRAPIIGAHPRLANVWLNLAHGSHALMTACAGAELLSALMLAEPAACPASLQRAVAPARFQHYFTAS